MASQPSAQPTLLARRQHRAATVPGAKQFTKAWLEIEVVTPSTVVPSPFPSASTSPGQEFTSD
eukprot:CAMPEP_0197618978 /NCGR_PEP_ID=MMETSP1338-20131121/47_1 /TAXON_ID=43686 ORGANISM="Pelagodinium beii, Strain RCC1491" /NCGR_SAMPLE_ID=MMETSP1338 /ASSEMBLY_ACC=CAM_ASM_000754 /LENGTH=62 /DNA_ID=CAMNT_0043187883 /DNA_START=44 /DNA_END=229 /DNA_ORIENTATION=-